MSITYDGAAAVAYAHKYALNPNPAYYNFEKIGGDCTNFISQCIYAGYPQVNYSQNGWYYRSVNDRAPAWTGVEFLYSFLMSKGQRRGPKAVDILREQLRPGDIIQLSFDGDRFSHSLIVVENSERGVLIATHTYNADYRPLDSYVYKKMRCFKIV